MGLVAYKSSGSGEYLKGFLPYLSMAASWSKDQEAVSMIRNYSNHRLQTNPLHNEEEPLNIYSNKLPVRQ